MDNIITVNEAKERLATILTTPLPRKELLKKCVESQNLTPEELKDRTSGKKLNIIKCRFGDAIEKLLKNGTLTKNQNNELEFYKEANDIKLELSRDNLIQDTIIKILENNIYTRKKLLNEICIVLSNQLSLNEKNLKSVAGKIIKELRENKQIFFNDGHYNIKNTEEPLNKKNQRLFYNLSDESLVEYSLQMLKKFLEDSKFYEINKCINIDGPNDGGIDGIINVTDKLGFHEKFIIQVKNFQNKSKFVPISEIREFYGVFSADIEASKAIFITKGKYHNDTLKFVEKIKDSGYLLIDGNKWLQLAEICQYTLPE